MAGPRCVIVRRNGGAVHHQCATRAAYRFAPTSLDERAAAVFVDMDAHDLVERALGLEAGLACVCTTVSATGSSASRPASGSRMMPEKKPEAALLGLPGRTTMLGRRIPTPSQKPRRV